MVASASGGASIDLLVKVCSYYRDAELRGSNLLYRMLRFVKDPEAQMNLSEHLADETRHAWLWTKRIRDLGRTPEPVEDGYQVRIGRAAGIPRNVVDLFALTVVVEQRALRRYQEHMRRPDVDEETLEVLRQVSKDEGWHLDWMRKKGRELAEQAGESQRFDQALKRFREVDRQVMEGLDDLEQSLT